MGEHLSADRRRALGAHYTPEPLARQLCELSLEHLGRIPEVVVDPSCGGGAFLIAAADALHARGVEPSEIVESRVVGIEVDAESAGMAAEALRSWAWAHGITATPRVIVADALADADALGDTERRDTPGADLVIGNPPFLSQLDADTAMDDSQRARLRKRFGFRSAYTDISAFHLLAATELLAPDGVVCMIQPQSLLGAHDAAPVREELLARCDLVGLWGSAASHFTAQVRVCAPILRARGKAPESVRTVVHWGSNGDLCEVAVDQPQGAAPWSPLLARAHGVPEVSAVEGLLVGDVARVTAGFRDEFYAIAKCTTELADVLSASGLVAADGPEVPTHPRVVTSGSLDPGRVLWGQRSVRIAGRGFAEPVLDLVGLMAAQPRIGNWVRDRLVPKVLVATQTKVLEAAVDPTGDLVPLTPVVSVEPTAPGVTPQMLGALLSAPAMSALMHDRAAGTGQSADAIRVSASAIAGLPIPANLDRWRSLTEDLPGAGTALPGESEALGALAPMLNRMADGAVCWDGGPEGPDAMESRIVEWWLQRLPRRRGAD